LPARRMRFGGWPALAAVGIVGCLSLPAAALAGQQTTTSSSTPTLLEKALSSGALVAENTNCGDGTAYLPANGGPMTAADLQALGQPIPAGNSPALQAGTQWIVPTCSPISSDLQPGGPEINLSTPTSPSTGASSNAGTVGNWNSPNWSGCQSNTGDTYFNAFAAATLPVPSTNPPGNTWESTWVGIGTGDSNSQGLLQAGTETDQSATGSVTKSAWWEFVPMNAQQSINGLDLQNGSQPTESVAHTGYGLGGVEVCGVTKCADIQVSWPAAYTLDTSRYECIAERTEVKINNVWTFPRVTNVTGLQFNLCEAQTSNGVEQYMGNHNRFFIYMSKNQTAAACGVAPWSVQTGSINGASFPINWIGYGWPVAANGCN
jgi:Peptidase A4 family